MIPAGRTSKRLIELDAVRGVAILLVLDYHYRHFEIFFAPLKLLGINNFGWAGVDVFFILSGFLIGGLLLLLYFGGSVRSQASAAYLPARQSSKYPELYGHQSGTDVDSRN